MVDDSLVLDALRRQGLIVDERGWRVEPISGGSTERVFVAVDAQSRPIWTLRHPRPEFAWRTRHEAVVLMHLAGVGLACAPLRPTIVADPRLTEGDMLVHAYVPGAPEALGAVSGRARETLGMCLAALHGQVRRSFTIWPELATRGGTRRDLYALRFRAMQRYASFGGGLGLGFAGRTARVLAGLCRPLPRGDGWEGREFSVLHGDLSIGNLLWSGDGVRLIDWEYLRVGDPAEDLAYLTTEQALAPEQWREIVGGYLAAGGDARAVERARRYRPLVALDAAFWWADYLAERQIDPSTSPDVARRLALAESLLDDGVD